LGIRISTCCGALTAPTETQGGIALSKKKKTEQQGCKR